jgi:hypothetical protein
MPEMTSQERHVVTFWYGSVSQVLTRLPVFMGRSAGSAVAQPLLAAVSIQEQHVVGKDLRKPFCLRLSPDLVEQVDAYAERLRSAGMPVSRTDVARMMIVRGLRTVTRNAESLWMGTPGESGSETA